MRRSVQIMCITDSKYLLVLTAVVVAGLPLPPGRHCEYQSLLKVQVYPEIHEVADKIES